MTGALFGAIIGALVGAGLSVYVFRRDKRLRDQGVRQQVTFRGSLVGVPIILAIIGALVGGLIA